MTSAADCSRSEIQSVKSRINDLPKMQSPIFPETEVNNRMLL